MYVVVDRQEGVTDACQSELLGLHHGLQDITSIGGAHVGDVVGEHPLHHRIDLGSLLLSDDLFVGAVGR